MRSVLPVPICVSRSKPAAVYIPVGNFKPNMIPVDISLEKPVYIPMISTSPMSRDLNVFSINVSGSVVENERSTQGNFAETPQSRLNMYWKPIECQSVRTFLSRLASADPFDPPIQFWVWFE